MSKMSWSKSSPSPAASGGVDVRELDRGQADHEAGLVDERERPGVVVDGRQVAHAADQRALGELADRAVAVGPVVCVLCRGERGRARRHEQAVASRTASHRRASMSGGGILLPLDRAWPPLALSGDVTLARVRRRVTRSREAACRRLRHAMFPCRITPSPPVASNDRGVEWRTTSGGSHEREGAELMRCDLHVHSWYSGRADVPVLEHLGRECDPTRSRSTRPRTAARDGPRHAHRPRHDRGRARARAPARHVRERGGDACTSTAGGSST